MTKNNYGISTDGGNVTATNLAVGEGATINIAGDMRVEIARELDAIRTAIKDYDLPPEDVVEITDAVDTIDAETKSDKADKGKVASALGFLGEFAKVGDGLTDLGVKLAPHVATLTRFLL